MFIFTHFFKVFSVLSNLKLLIRLSIDENWRIYFLYDVLLLAREFPLNFLVWLHPQHCYFTWFFFIYFYRYNFFQDWYKKKTHTCRKQNLPKKSFIFTYNLILLCSNISALAHRGHKEKTSRVGSLVWPWYPVHNWTLTTPYKRHGNNVNVVCSWWLNLRKNIKVVR